MWSVKVQLLCNSLFQSVPFKLTQVCPPVTFARLNVQPVSFLQLHTNKSSGCTTLCFYLSINFIISTAWPFLHQFSHQIIGSTMMKN